MTNHHGNASARRRAARACQTPARAFRRLLHALRRDERGTQLVELALVVPLFLMMVGAVGEFGRFFYTYSTLSKATRAGARYQISQPPGSPDATAKNLVVYGNPAGTGSPVVAGLSASNVKVTPNKTGGAVQTVTVSISSFNYQPIFDLGKLTKSPSLSLSVNVGASSTMRQLVQ
ncbi:MAG: pilus assembly protein [Acidobacteria bacterium]|nr:pilus assembly protein [Acidobacteriota bacterium]